MPQHFVYLDHLASTPTAPEVLEAMSPFLSQEYGNPSAIHHLGLNTAEAIENARESVPPLIQAQHPEEIIFTSGGTESANMVLKGTAFFQQSQPNPKKHFILSTIEHPSLEQSAQFLETLGFHCSRIPVDAQGKIDLQALQDSIQNDTFLIATHHSNFDVGTIQEVQEIGKIATEKNIPFFVDATTSGGWVPIDVQKFHADFLSLSPHRFFGPKGVGILYKRKGTALEPLVHGGKQEHQLRAGTENVAGIVGAGKAAELASQQQVNWTQKTGELQHYLWKEIQSQIDEAQLNGAPLGVHRDPHHLNISIEKVEGEALMLLMDVRGIAFTSGTGCLTRSNLSEKASPVLQAMGIDLQTALNSILLSPGPSQSKEDMQYVVEQLKKAVVKIRSM